MLSAIDEECHLQEEVFKHECCIGDFNSNEKRNFYTLSLPT